MVNVNTQHGLHVPIQNGKDVETKEDLLIIHYLFKEITSLPLHMIY